MDPKLPKNIEQFRLHFQQRAKLKMIYSLNWDVS